MTWGHGWALVIRGSDGVLGLKTEEPRACMFALRKVIHHGFKNVVVEGDCAFLIAKIKKKEC